jgi:predicted nucleic acid-binding protein
LIIDSDILIAFLNRSPAAAVGIERVPRGDCNISVVSYLEVLYGCRNKKELHEFQQFVPTALAELILLNEAISRRAAQIMETYVLARRLDTADALLAATAFGPAEPLGTANLKHFDFVPGLELKSFRPGVSERKHIHG